MRMLHTYTYILLHTLMIHTYTSVTSINWENLYDIQYNYFNKTTQISPYGDIQIYLVKYHQDCDLYCHKRMKDHINHVCLSSYRIMDSIHAIFHCHIHTAMNKLLTAEDFIDNILPIVPEAKISQRVYNTPHIVARDTEVRAMLNMVVDISFNNKSVIIHSIDEVLKEFSFTYSSRSVLEFLTSDSSTLMVEGPIDHVSELAQYIAMFEFVEWVEPALTHNPLNKWATGSCQSGDPNLPVIYWANITGAGQVVGIADTGLDVNSCFFFDPLEEVPYNMTSMSHKKLVTYITYADYVDSDGHGTHVSGSAAGKCDDTKQSVGEFNGLAYNAKVAFFDIGTGSGDFQDPVELIIPNDINENLCQVLFDQGARVINLSWGAMTNAYTIQARDIDQFMWSHPEALVVAAAGNNGESSFGSINSPATSKNCVSVGASLNDKESWDDRIFGSNEVYSSSTLAGFSSRGPTSDNRVKPDIVAPGQYIISADSSEKYKYTCDVKSSEGTSSASPLVAASAVLVRQWFVDGYYPTGERNENHSFVPSGALLKAVLIHSGQSLTAILNSDMSITSTTYGDSNQGYGRVQLDEVLSFGSGLNGDIGMYVIGSAYRTSEMYREMTYTDEVHAYNITVSSSEDPLKITLVYTDYPAVAGTVKALVNDLDIVLTNGSHSWYSLQSAVNAAVSDIPSDNTNNVEVIVLPQPYIHCNYTLTVHARSLSHTQPYALVMTSHITHLNYTLSDVSLPSESTAINWIVRALIAGAISVMALTVFYVLWTMGVFRRLTCMRYALKRKRKWGDRTQKQPSQSLYASSLSFQSTSDGVSSPQASWVAQSRSTGTSPNAEIAKVRLESVLVSVDDDGDGAEKDWTVLSMPQCESTEVSHLSQGWSCITSTLSSKELSNVEFQEIPYSEPRNYETVLPPRRRSHTNRNRHLRASVASVKDGA